MDRSAGFPERRSFGASSQPCTAAAGAVATRAYGAGIGSPADLTGRTRAHSRVVMYIIVNPD
jgi:hypothetical protein